MYLEIKLYYILKEVYLNNNYITDINNLNKYLKFNKSLKYIFISFNEINANDVINLQKNYKNINIH